MKKPLLSELTLREKIGQTVVLSPRVMAEVTDIDEYFKNNPEGSIKYYSNWKFGPDNIAIQAIKRDKKLLFQD